MIRRKTPALLILSLLTILFAVANGPSLVFAQDVRTNYMPGTDFAKFKSYRWGTIEGGSHPNQIVDAEIKSAVDKQMVEKGFTKVDGTTADLTVAYQVAVDKERQWNAMAMGGVRRGGMAMATSTAISVGRLVLDFYDPAAKQLVCQGQATKTLNPQNSQEKNQKNLDNAMKKLPKNFPPKVK